MKKGETKALATHLAASGIELHLRETVRNQPGYIAGLMGGSCDERKGDR